MALDCNTCKYHDRYFKDHCIETGCDNTLIDNPGWEPIETEVREPKYDFVHEVKPIKSDGGPTSYYELPEGATELRHVIAGKQMGFARGNVFKAMYRLGEKEGTDVMYDINKSRLFLDDMEEAYKKGLKI